MILDLLLRYNLVSTDMSFAASLPKQEKRFIKDMASTKQEVPAYSARIDLLVINRISSYVNIQFYDPR